VVEELRPERAVGQGGAVEGGCELAVGREVEHICCGGHRQHQGMWHDVCVAMKWKAVHKYGDLL
jgi:hypothetical protein